MTIFTPIGTRLVIEYRCNQSYLHSGESSNITIFTPIGTRLVIECKRSHSYLHSGESSNMTMFTPNIYTTSYRVQENHSYLYIVGSSDTIMYISAHGYLLERKRKCCYLRGCESSTEQLPVWCQRRRGLDGCSLGDCFRPSLSSYSQL